MSADDVREDDRWDGYGLSWDDGLRPDLQELWLPPSAHPLGDLQYLKAQT